MQKTYLCDPNTNEKPEDICWHNLKVADENYNLNMFIGASMGWLELNKTKDYQDLEKELRNKNFNTHLIAVTPIDIPNSKVKLHGQDKKYECIFSCRPKESAIKELLKYSKSYEENFAKLIDAGSIIINNKNDLNDKEDTKILDNEDQQFLKSISKNKKKIKVEEMTANQYFDEICEMCQKQFGKNPKEKIVGITRNGSPVFGLFIENKLASLYGFMIEIKSDGDEIMKSIKLFDLRTLS